MLSRIFVELFIAWRYLRSQGPIPIFSIGTRISLLFMALMVFVMIIVLSVFSGFQGAVKETLLQSGYHLRITSQSGRPFYGYKKILKLEQKLPELQKLLRHTFPSVSLNVLLESYGQFEGKGMRALPYIPGKDVQKSMQYFPPLVHYNKSYLRNFNGGSYILIGREMARYYGLQIGEKVNLLLPRGGFLKKDIKINQHAFTIAGFYRTGFYEFDFNLMFVSLRTAQNILQIANRATEVVFQIKDLANLDTGEQLLRENLPQPSHFYNVHSIREERGNFLAALQLEKTLMMIVLSLLIIAGVAGIWVTVRLLVKARSRSIGMLRAMGMSTRSLLFIFTFHSMLIGLLATAIGGSLGIYVANRMETLILLVEDLINYGCQAIMNSCGVIRLIPANVYYFDHLPVQAEFNIVFGIGIVTLILSGIAGYLPALEAARLNPVQTIRSE